MKISDYYYEFRKNTLIPMTVLFNFQQENLPYVKKARIGVIPVSFINTCKMFLDESSLPASCADVTDLSNKCVIYGIYCNGKFYIGSTSDFGWRMASHIKDTKKDKRTQRLYKDMVKYGECVVFILGIADNKDLMKEVESFLIKKCKEYSIAKSCNFDENSIKFINESNDDIKEYSRKYCYNIIE